LICSNNELKKEFYEFVKDVLEKVCKLLKIEKKLERVVK